MIGTANLFMAIPERRFVANAGMVGDLDRVHQLMSKQPDQLAGGRSVRLVMRR